MKMRLNKELGYAVSAGESQAARGLIYVTHKDTWCDISLVLPDALTVANVLTYQQGGRWDAEEEQAGRHIACLGNGRLNWQTGERIKVIYERRADETTHI